MESKDDYLNEHLPYRINFLLAPDLITHRRNTTHSNELKVKCYQDSLVLEPTFEISIIFGRALLQFLGITYNVRESKLGVYSPKPDDITIKSLFPERQFCPLDDEIIIQNQAELCTIIKIANKSVAHLTTVFSSGEEQQHLSNARMTIYKLILKYIPEINKQKIWWYTQVET